MSKTTSKTSISVEFDDDDGVRVKSGGQLVPRTERGYEILLTPTTEPTCKIEFKHDDPLRTIAVEYYDDYGHLRSWEGDNPAQRSFRLSRGEYSNSATCSTSNESREPIIIIKIEPKTDKPFRI